MTQSDTLSFRISPNNRWFLVLAALSVLPFLLSAGYSLLQLSQSKQDDVAERLIVTANATAQLIKERLAASVAALNAIASSDAATREDLPALYLQAQRVMQRMPENSGIALISANGSVLFTTLQPFGSPAFPARTPATWTRVFDTSQAVASEPFVNPTNQRYSVAVGVPIFHQGKVVYCLSMVFITSSINDLLMSLPIPEKWTTEVMSESGRLIAHSNALNIEIGAAASDEIMTAKHDQVAGLFGTRASDGSPQKAIIAQVGSFDWWVTITVPLNTLNEPVHHVTILLFIFGSAFAILGGLAVSVPTYMLRDIPVDAGFLSPTEGSIERPRTHLIPSLVALAASIALGAYTAWLTQGNLNRIAAAVETHERINAELRMIDELIYLFKELDTGQRGFAASGNEIFLEHFETASKRIPALTRLIKAEFSKSDPQDFNWADFDGLLNQYLQFAANDIALRHRSRASALQDEAALASGKLIVDKMQLQTNEMRSRLDNKISSTDISIELQREQASRQQWLSSFAVSALFLISVAFWLYEHQRRLQVHGQLQENNHLLEERVAQRTHELATANQRILLYAQEAQALIDSERKRLSREVHDQVGQIFSAIKIIVGSLKSGHLDAEQQASLLNAVDSGVKISRRIAAELRPPLLDDFGLRLALEHYLKSVCEPAGLSYDFHFPDGCRLAQPQMSELFRMVQEACVNVIRHAKAMHMEVVGRISGEYLDVCIDDDGVGNDEASIREGALGILGMRERAHLIDAQIHFGSSPMGGTRVHIKVPLEKPEMKERL